METEFYICEFCQTEFKPKRRKAQKFCSATCRVKNHHHKNKVTIESVTVPTNEQFNAEVLESTLVADKTKIDKISPAGIGNAALGTLAADAAKALANHVLGSAENDPATKGDIQELKNLFKKRFILITNLPPRPDGSRAYFDMETSSQVYFSFRNAHNALNYGI